MAVIQIPTTMLQRAVKVGRKFQNPVPTAVGGPGMIFKILPRLIANREGRVPKRPLGPFRTDAAVYESPAASGLRVTGLRVTWFGHSSMLLEIDGVRVLIDPVWDERASPQQWVGPKRFFAPTLALEELPRLDAVLLSHDHYDHLGEGTVRRLAALRPETPWVTSLGVGAILRQFGVGAERITELDWTESVTVSGAEGAACEITSLPARHFSGRSLGNRFETLWASFVLRGVGAGSAGVSGGRGHSVYFGADSGWWEGFAEIGAAYGPFDLTVLEIGAFDEMWARIHLGPDGAARAFQAIAGAGDGAGDSGSSAAGLLMPIHWGLFDLALHAWRQPIERLTELADADGLRLWSPEPGRPTEVVRGVELRSGWWRR
ncbi:MAG: MBL fold metallo-hydrolase [Acidobacteriaceae bacterium]|jgi:L-ascorbate metabolism protein UlaG (beta-lactamase superfamily)